MTSVWCFAVIDHLDVLKKETVGARDAIRWLEAEFHKGNRSVLLSYDKYRRRWYED